VTIRGAKIGEEVQVPGRAGIGIIRHGDEIVAFWDFGVSNVGRIVGYWRRDDRGTGRTRFYEVTPDKKAGFGVFRFKPSALNRPNKGDNRGA